MTGVSHDTQAGEVTETWSMSSSVLLQTESIDIEVFCRSTELRGEVLESRQRLGELHQTFMRAVRREELDRVNYPDVESEEITRLALEYFGGAKQVELGPIGYERFRRAVADFAKEASEHGRELVRNRRQAEIAGTRFLSELERHVETFTPLDGDRRPLTYIALDSGWLQERRRFGLGADLAEPDVDDTYIFESAEVIGRFVYSAVASFDLSPEMANTLAGELYSALEKMPIPVYGSVPESIKSFVASLSGTGFVGAIGYSSDLESVTLTCFSAGAAFIFWFGRPHVTTVRDTSNEWLKRKLNSKLGLAEDRDED
ncbi:hypothetical protein ABZU78_25700 [Rhodococcus erythropolis]|uniref:hypothetical protein n=1 Tax=Rhodococcus erythropolis TaxID=1833 RepID=UPI0033BD361D